MGDGAHVAGGHASASELIQEAQGMEVLKLLLKTPCTEGGLALFVRGEGSGFGPVTICISSV